MLKDHAISQDKVTVKKCQLPMTFLIYHQNKEITQVSISANATNRQLLCLVKKEVPLKTTIIALYSIADHQVLDYMLMNPQNSVQMYRNYERLGIIQQSKVYSLQYPTLQDFIFIKCLGQGVSSNVFLVRHVCSGLFYALKQIKKNYFNDFKRLEQVLRQKKIMTQKLKDISFTSKLYASFESQQHLNLLIQFYPGGQMFYHLQRQKLNQSQARFYFAQMIVTFEQLHSQQIIYRDLKPENIMIDIKGHAKLADFGLCKINLEKDDLTYSYCGSLQYMAPQAKNEIGYGYSVDFYTLGAFLHQMVTGVPPYYGNKPLVFPQEVSDQFIELTLRLIEKDPSKRLVKFSEIKKAKWLQKINWDKVIRKQYSMPLKLQPYTSYIHDQFKQIKVPQLSNTPQKYDMLFDMFAYMSNQKKGISAHYFSGVQKNKISVDSKDNSVKSKKRKKSVKQKKNKDKSRTIELPNQPKSQQNQFHRRSNLKQSNIYTNPSKSSFTKSSIKPINRIQCLNSAALKMSNQYGDCEHKQVIMKKVKSAKIMSTVTQRDYHK